MGNRVVEFFFRPGMEGLVIQTDNITSAAGTCANCRTHYSWCEGFCHGDSQDWTTFQGILPPGEKVFDGTTEMACVNLAAMRLRRQRGNLKRCVVDPINIQSVQFRT